MANVIGRWSFVGGVILAIIFGIFGLSQTIVTILLVLGLIIGLLNVTGKETHNMLIASVALVLVSALGRNVISAIPQVVPVLDAINVLVVAATIIVALKTIVGVTKN